MSKLNPRVVARLQEITDEYKTSTGVTAQELRLYVWFHECLYNEILDLGGEETGYVFRHSYRGVLLVYKATFDGVRRVVFITAHTPVQCMQIFCRQLYEGQLDWVKDKFP